MSEFSERLRFALKRAEISQKELVNEMTNRGIKISTSALNYYATGARKRPRKEVVALMAEILGVSFSWLLSGEEAPQRVVLSESLCKLVERQHRLVERHQHLADQQHKISGLQQQILAELAEVSALIKLNIAP